MADDITQQKDEEPSEACVPQLAEVNQTIPSPDSCTGSYLIETPLLVSTWKPESVTVAVTGITSRCSGTTAVVEGTKVRVTFAGSGGGGAGCTTLYAFEVPVTESCCTPGAPPTLNYISAPHEITGKPSAITKTIAGSCDDTTQAWTITTTSGTFPFAPAAPGDISCGFLGGIKTLSLTNVHKVNPSDPDCEDTVTVRYEGCSTKPKGTYGDDNPAPGGGSPGGGGTPSGSPPSGDSPPPPSSPPSFGGGGNPGGGGSNNNPPPPAAPPGSTNNPPSVSSNTQQGSGDAIFYPDGTILTPEPEPEFPPLMVILPGSDPTPYPWNGYAFFPSVSSGTIVFGTAYPALYISPMLSQKLFGSWKALKHAFLQFDNRKGSEIHTALTTTDAGLRGKALHKFNANVGVVYNDEMSDEVILDLYRYDQTQWALGVYSKHFSPKQLDQIVMFKEPLLGVSYSYQVAVFSSDANTWRLVGWQVEGTQKGKRVGHSRN